LSTSSSISFSISFFTYGTLNKVGGTNNLVYKTMNNIVGTLKNAYETKSSLQNLEQSWWNYEHLVVEP